MITRKKFIGSMLAAGAAGCTGLDFTKNKRYYRGMLHMHSFWSDGSVFPEQAIAVYKDAGYDFVSLSDHNRFQDDPSRWFPLGDGTDRSWPPKSIHPKCFKAYMDRFGKTAEVRERNGKKEVRLLTYSELKRMFDAPGEFLTLPGVEITTNSSLPDRTRVMHMNVIGFEGLIERFRKARLNESIPNKSPADIMRETYYEYEKIVTERGLRKPVFMLNHPQWPFCDILPADMIAAPEICGFEICNNRAKVVAPKGYRDDLFGDAFWDATLASRMVAGQGLLYAFASDDTHTHPGCGLPSKDYFKDGYIMVKADELSEKAIFDAIAAGDFYASSELDLDDVVFDASSGTLAVSATPKAGQKLKITFITTKKGTPLDPVSYLEVPAKNKKKIYRKIPIYDKGIGATVKTAESRGPGQLVASYTMKDDDLYVRARIESDARSTYYTPGLFHVQHPTAWTQPYKRK